MFAKPFVGSLDGHRDGLTCLIKHPKVQVKKWLMNKRGTALSLGYCLVLANCQKFSYLNGER